MKAINKKLTVLSLTAILLLAGCGIHQQNNIDISADSASTTSEQAVQTTLENNGQSDKPEVTTHKETAEQTTEPEETFPDCFVAPDPDSHPYDVQIFNSQDCEPGYLYFEGSGSAEDRLLLDIKFKKHLPVEEWWQTNSSVYAVTEDNELLKVSKRDGSYDVLYTAQYGEIDSICISKMFNNKQGVEEVGRLLYITDGDNIVIFETETDKYTVVHCENGLSKFWRAGFQEDNAIYIPDDVYICDECGYDGNYVIWEDNDGNYFWYHPETGENEPLKLGDNGGLATFFVKAD